ncbi:MULTISPECIES: hypothetical protein [Agrobacterium]|uniref:hypothetical protein n=1 Tax=Agrobacterium tumefaciens TaxID=358 RepID=UPI000EF17C3E|nr:hypothetical protein [Agrobacterium tumefaciens]NSY93322.1 hypothetical protein [Agrobacterium tumefaciens]
MDTTKQNRLALFWLTTALGAVLFVTIQSFSYLNDYVRAQGSTPAVTFDAGGLWMLAIFYGVWIVPVLLALIGTSSANWAMLILGGLLATLNTLAGVFDGVRDGGHIAFTALLCIALPGACAIVASWRHIRANRAGFGGIGA